MSGAERNRLPRHAEALAQASASPEQVFAFVDDHARFSSHMSQSSWRMGGGRMIVSLDDHRGQSVGSHIVMSGRVLGLALCIDEVVTERQPPRRKVWETVGTPALLIIGPYRMGFEVSPGDGASSLRVFIDYALPRTWPERWLGRLFSNYYARWCVQRMADDAARHFSSPAASHQLSSRRVQVSPWILGACGLWLVALGCYFAFLRPALLPEDPRFIGTPLAEIQTAIPGLEPWLRRVFAVMGGLLAGAGVLTMFVATAGMRRRSNGTAWVIGLSGALTVGLMSAINFSLNSDFKWVLLVPAIFWFAALVLYLAKR